jgi:hypothetical protein
MAASVAATHRGGAILMDQGETGPVDLQDHPGGLGDPEQPGQQVVGFGQGRLELADGPGDHGAVNSHSHIPRSNG